MRFPVRLTVLSILYLIINTQLLPQDYIEQQGYASRPILTKYGIVFTDNFGSTIRIKNDSEERELFSSAGCGNFYSISPDENFIGTKIIDAAGMQTPAIINISTGEVKKLYPASGQCGEVSFTVDGRYAFTSGKELVITDISGKMQKYYLGNYSNIAPVSPDGRYAVYNDMHDQLWVMELSTGSKQKITDDKNGYYCPQWSADGQMILYSSLDGIIKVYDTNKNISYLIGEGTEPSWPRSGHSQIVFYRKEIKDLKLISSDLFISSFDGSSKKRLTDTPEIMEMDPQFSGDNSEIVYHTYNKNEINIASLTTVQNCNISIDIKKSYAVSSKVRAYEMNTSLKKVSTLDMPYVHQAYDTPDYFNGSSACGATTAIMVIAYYNLLPEWDILCTYHKPDHISHWGRYICDEYNFKEFDFYYSAAAGSTRGQGGYGFMWNGGSSPYSTIADYYTRHGISSSRTDSPDHSLVLSEINAGYPYTLCVALTTAGHIVAAHGVGSEPHTLIFNDPWGNKNSGSYPSENGKNVSYDWPGYNNGYQNLKTVFWGVSCRAASVPQADTLVDDLQFKNGFVLSNQAPASMLTWRDKNQGYKSHFWYTYTTSSLTKDTSYAEWHPDLPKAGSYEVFAYIPYGYATDARYKITHKNGTATVSVNQKPVKNSWVSLGTYNFDQGKSGYVRLGDGSTVRGEAIVFDALKWSYVGSQVSSVNDGKMPVDFTLYQNYPNPFNPSTKITFDLSESNFVTLKAYDILGNEVETLANGYMQPGQYNVKFPSNNVRLQSGIYFLRLQAGELVRTIKATMIK